MLRMVASRLISAVPNLIGVVIVTFCLTRALPGDPAAFFAGPAATTELIAEIRRKLGLDRGLVEQFGRYLHDLSSGDLGNSLTTGQSVMADLLARLPASMELTLFALLFAASISFPIGVLAANHQDSWIDHLCRVVATAGQSLPTFFLGLFLVYLFYYLLGWAPAPLGRLDITFSAPPHVTGFYVVDGLIAGQFRLCAWGTESLDSSLYCTRNVCDRTSHSDDTRCYDWCPVERFYSNRSGKRLASPSDTLPVRLEERYPSSYQYVRNGIFILARSQCTGRKSLRLARRWVLRRRRRDSFRLRGRSRLRSRHGYLVSRVEPRD